MVAVHVSDDDDRHLFRGITGSLQAFRKLARARLATSFAKPSVEENDLGSGIDQDRGKAVDEAAGRQEILFQKLGDRLRRLIGTEDLVRLVRGARPVADHRHLETSEFQCPEVRALAHAVLFRRFLSTGNTCKQAWCRQRARACREQRPPLQLKCHRHSLLLTGAARAPVITGEK